MYCRRLSDLRLFTVKKGDFDSVARNKNLFRGRKQLMYCISLSEIRLSTLKDSGQTYYF